MVILESGDFGWDFILRDEETNRSVLVQSDWDYPGVAKYLGWSPSRVVAYDVDRDCQHDCTDGTIQCANCGMPSSEFIISAREWLDDHVGEGFEAPGHFNE